MSYYNRILGLILIGSFIFISCTDSSESQLDERIQIENEVVNQGYDAIKEGDPALSEGAVEISEDSETEEEVVE